MIRHVVCPQKFLSKLKWQNITKSKSKGAECPQTAIKPLGFQLDISKEQIELVP